MIVMPTMTPQQEASWHGLLDLYERLPGQWALIGGQMVHLHCAERQYSPRRPTPDVDAVLDVRANPKILLTFTEALMDLGFASAGVSMQDRQHRFVRGDASIDVLIPNNVGPRLSGLKGATGSPTLQTPGGIQALRRSETVEVDVAGRIGHVRRPNLIGALIVKAAAHTIPGDQRRGRHRSDFATLAALLSRRDLMGEALSKKERNYLRLMLSNVGEDAAATDGLTEIEDGLARLSVWLN